MDSNTIDNVANAMGICLVLNNSQSVNATELEVMDDIKGEQETCAADAKEVLANIQAASKGVKEGTAAAVMAQFNAFLAEEKTFMEHQLHPKIDYYIVGFIMQGCDNVDMHGVSKVPDEPQKSYSYAQKLWASTTYGFHKGGRGKGTLRRFYDHNHDPQNWNASPETPGNWCGGNVQKLLQAVYLIMFTCLLWIDEALKIQLHDIEFGNDNVDGTHFVSITLPFHKSSPFGVNNTAMKPEVFLQLFHNNLCNLGEPPYAYGTHSFCHGGCQWLSVDLADM
ncbi:hypothetical protein ARMGADRAFT_1032484 [Armillaria gallica]|uniref:Uncharacterized protein n=1 Tax=Armillaria gallica TaxID=47427 RepID=A0A2H3D5F4_ARMGA|nr:hypothetical protein ARMGADRAFT_1032484 [Armillaria gallica]